MSNHITICSYCSGTHTYENCTKAKQKEQPHCVNCKGQHSAAYKECPVYKNVESALYDRALYCVQFKDVYKPYDNNRIKVTDRTKVDARVDIDNRQVKQPSTNLSHPRPPIVPTTVIQRSTDKHLPQSETNKETLQQSVTRQTQQNNIDFTYVLVTIMKILMELCQTLQQTYNIDCNVAAETLANVLQQCNQAGNRSNADAR